MNTTSKRSTTAVLAAAVAATLVLGACSRDDRQEARTEGREAANATSNTANTAAGTASAAIDDAALTTKVKAALLADDQVKGTQINVDSTSGTVRLTGTVDSQSHVQRAEQVARGVQGVQRIENNLAASANAAPGLVPGTQPAGTAPSATPLPNSTTPATK